MMMRICVLEFWGSGGPTLVLGCCRLWGAPVVGIQQLCSVTLLLWLFQCDSACGFDEMITFMNHTLWTIKKLKHSTTISKGNVGVRGDQCSAVTLWLLIIAHFLLLPCSSCHQHRFIWFIGSNHALNTTVSYIHKDWTYAKQFTNLTER